MEPIPRPGRPSTNQLQRKGERVREVVPECVGMSLSALEHGVTSTLVATTEEVLDLDATQYLDGGPCLRALEEPDVL
jgi:hypothetical protein